LQADHLAEIIDKIINLFIWTFLLGKVRLNQGTLI